jgi:Phosphate-induced protein 1 conserved region
MCGLPKRWLHFSLTIIAVLSLFGGEASAQTGSRTLKTASRIVYHDGQVMTGTSNVYFIWYGCWTCGFPGSNDDTILRVGEFVATLGNTAYARILRTYPDGNGAAPSGGFVYSGEAYDATYSHGAALTTTDVEDVVKDTILNGALPLDLYGIYMVMVSADVTVPGLEVNTCAYHGYTTVVGAQVRYGAFNNPARAPGICAPQFRGKSPNDNVPADALVSAMASAINGIVTNPTGTGWYDRYGLEAPDKCAGTYGQTYTTTNGATANVNIGGYDLLLPQNWVNVGKGYCAMHQ